MVFIQKKIHGPSEEPNPMHEFPHLVPSCYKWSVDSLREPVESESDTQDEFNSKIGSKVMTM